jgi:hypothetical protein
MSDVKLDLFLSFPVDAYHESEYAKLVKYCGSLEEYKNIYDILSYGK